MDVYLLWHVHEMPDDEEDVKLIGVYASPEDAEAGKARVGSQPGFRDTPDGFLVDRYVIGEDHWAEGFVTETHEDILRRYGQNND